MRQLNIKLPDEVKNKLEERSNKTGVSEAGIVKSALAEELGV